MGRGQRGLPTGSLTYEWVKAIHHLNGIQPEGSHVTSAVDHVQTGTVALQAAKILQKNSRKCMCIAMIILIVIAIIVILIAIAMRLGLSIFDSPRAIIAPSYDKLTSTDRDRNPMEITQSSVSEMMNVTEDRWESGSVNELDLNLSIEILEQIHHPRRRRFMHKGAYLRASDPYQGISQSQFVVNLVINTKKGKDILLHESAIVCIGTI
ncbi:hypothetical protein C3L33_10301, partial [Rhododendron williamsianum]